MVLREMYPHLGGEEGAPFFVPDCIGAGGRSCTPAASGASMGERDLAVWLEWA